MPSNINARDCNIIELMMELELQALARAAKDGCKDSKQQSKTVVKQHVALPAKSRRARRSARSRGPNEGSGGLTQGEPGQPAAPARCKDDLEIPELQKFLQQGPLATDNKVPSSGRRRVVQDYRRWGHDGADHPSSHLSPSPVPAPPHEHMRQDHRIRKKKSVVRGSKPKLKTPAVGCDASQPTSPHCEVVRAANALVELRRFPEEMLIPTMSTDVPVDPAEGSRSSLAESGPTAETREELAGPAHDEAAAGEQRISVEENWFANLEEVRQLAPAGHPGRKVLVKCTEQLVGLKVQEPAPNPDQSSYLEEFVIVEPEASSSEWPISMDLKSFNLLFWRL